MSRTTSPSTQKPYCLVRVCQVWRLPRSTLDWQRRPQGRQPTKRPGPVGPCADHDLVPHLKATLAATPFHGEGYRKVWARLRYADIRTSKRRVLRLMREHQLLAPLMPTLPIQSGARQTPHSADPDQAIRLPGGGRGGPAHLLDLRRDKGRPSSRCSIFFWRSSLSMVTSPSFCRNRAISSSRASWGRFFSSAWPARRNWSRHFDSRAAVIPSSRESSSRSSPRSRRKTISIFRRAEKRLIPWPGPSPVTLRAPSDGSGGAPQC